MNSRRTGFVPKEPGLFSWIRDMLLSHDAYFVLGDFGAYADTQATIATRVYEDGGVDAEIDSERGADGAVFERPHGD